MRGGGTAAQALGQTVINLGSAPPSAAANLLKFIGPPAGAAANYPTAITSDGYPVNQTLSSAIGWGLQIDQSYYGRYKWWWSGSITTGAVLMQGNPALVYSGGSSVAGNGSNATAQSVANFAIGGSSVTQPTQASPVEVAWGFLIGGSVAQSGGLVQFTTAIGLLFGSGVTTGWQVQFNNLTYNGGAFPSGPNVDGSWTLTNTGATTFTLNGSDGSLGSQYLLNPALISIVNAGGPGVQTEAILPAASSLQIQSGAVISNLDNMVFCKSADAGSIIANPASASTDIINVFKTTKPRFVRVMDFQATQGDRTTGYGPKGTLAYQSQPSHMCWGIQGSFIISDYYTPSSSIANGGASGGFTDVYTCLSPASSPTSGAYQDGEIVIGQFGASATNTGNRPALNLNGRGAAPIYEGIFAQMFTAFWTGTAPPIGTTFTAAFSGAGLNGTHNVNFTSTGASLSQIWIDFANVAQADATLLGLGILVGNQQGQVSPILGNAGGIFYCPNATFSAGSVQASLGGANFSVTITASAGTASYTFGTLGTGQITNSGYASFTYIKRLGGWFCVQSSTPSVLHLGAPLEFYADICTKANIGLYLTVGQLWSDQRITDTVTKLAQLGIKELLIELSNETWNFGLQEWNFTNTMGAGSGLISSGSLNLGPTQAWIGLRTLQISRLAAAAWTAAGKARSTLFVNICTQLGETSGGLPLTYKMLGANLNAATPTGLGVVLAAYGGPGATALTTDYSSFPNRPIDYSDAMGQAPYWGGLMCNSGNGIHDIVTSVPLSSYNALLLAAYNFRYGTTAEKSAALDVLYSGGAAGTGDLYGNTPGGFVLATFTASVSGRTLTVSGVTGTIDITSSQCYVSIPGVPANTRIIANLGGGQYRLSASGSARSVAGNAYKLGGFQPSFANTLSLYFNGDAATGTPASYYQMGVAAASMDTQRTGLPAGQVGQAKCGVIDYEGAVAFGPAQAGDIAAFASDLGTLGYTNGYTSSLPGATTNGSPPTGAADTAALASNNVFMLINGNYGAIPSAPQTTACFKNDSRYFDLCIRYFTEAQASKVVGGSRVACSTWYGFYGDSSTGPNWWSLYLGGLHGPSQGVNALAAFGGS